MKRKKLAFLTLIIIVGLVLFINKNQSQNQNQDKKSPPPSPILSIKSRPVGVYLGKDYIQIEQDNIFINPCGEGSCVRPSMVIDDKSYPELFKTYDEFTRIDVEPIHDISGKDFIFFTQNVPDHGGYATLYGIIVDPEAKSVIYTTPKELKSPLATYQILPSAGDILFNLNPYLFNNSCTSCRLGILETVAYDPKLKKYVSVNQRSIPGFKTLLEQYEKAANNCYFQGKERTVDEVISLGGNDARCGDENTGNRPFDANSGALTVGEFKNIENSIQKIVNGTEQSLVHY